MRHNNGLALYRYCAVAWLIAVSSLANAQHLYDAGFGTLPEAQGWVYGGLGTVTRNVAGGALLFDTSAANSTQAGCSYAGNNWDRTNGLTLVFDLQLNAESHVSINRAGFSIILLGADAHGIELGFWTNGVFAQTDSPLFTHGEEANFSTTDGFINFSLTLLATNYVLRTNNVPVLSGPIRDYTAFSGFPNPYRTRNFLFFGDNTTSASGSVNLRSMVLVLPPSLTMPGPGIIAWSGVSNQTYHVEVSTDLVSWSPAGVATSATDSFRFTNNPAAPSQFSRVVFP